MITQTKHLEKSKCFFVAKKETDMFIWQLILNALGLLVLVIICGFIASAVKGFIKVLKK